MLKLIEKNNYKNLYLANFNKKYLDDNDKNTKMPDTKYIIFINDPFINKLIISIQLKLSIRFI